MIEYVYSMRRLISFAIRQKQSYSILFYFIPNGYLAMDLGNKIITKLMMDTSKMEYCCHLCTGATPTPSS